MGSWFNTFRTSKVLIARVKHFSDSKFSGLAIDSDVSFLENLNANSALKKHRMFSSVVTFPVILEFLPKKEKRQIVGRYRHRLSVLSLEVYGAYLKACNV